MKFKSYQNGNKIIYVIKCCQKYGEMLGIIS